jgi:hypothetical protein
MENKVPKCGRSGSTDWTSHDVVNLIRRTIYRGFDRHRVKISKKRLVSGKQKMEWAPEDKIWTREMPHLRIVSDDLWYRANAAIDARRRDNGRVRGPEHPLHGIPRDSRGPLSNLFVCGCCGSKMSMEGRNEGGYRCSAVRRRKCWVKATALRDEVHAAISKAVVERLLAPEALVDEFIRYAESVYADDTRRAAELETLVAREQELAQTCQRFGDAIEQGKGKLETVVSRLEQTEATLACIRGDLKKLRAEMSIAQPMPTRNQIEESLQRMAGALIAGKPESRTLLESLIDDKIRAVPYRQLGGKLVVLRAEFVLNLVGLLPSKFAAAVRGDLNGAYAPPPQKISVLVNLFEPSGAPANALAAKQLHDRGLSLEKIGIELKISKRLSHLALTLGKAMSAAGTTDPYERLPEAPTEASRWRSKHNPPTQQREAG